MEKRLIVPIEAGYIPKDFRKFLEDIEAEKRVSVEDGSEVIYLFYLRDKDLVIGYDYKVSEDVAEISLHGNHKNISEVEKMLIDFEK